MPENGLDVASLSGLCRSPAFPPGAGPDFVNAVAAVRTNMGPEEVLSVLHGIEAAHGRVRKLRWSARTLDLDLLAMGDAVLPDLDTWRHWASLSAEEQAEQIPDRLILPHPRIQDRPFVLLPLAEILPEWTHPVTGLSVTAMLAALSASERDAVTPL